jgi:hypothetical protein
MTNKSVPGFDLRNEMEQACYFCAYECAYIFNLGCLHPVARVISYDVGFNPSTQRHYRR